mgnify:CR=1 FL=1|jgi:hypothetical protein|tara:strand:- start:30211 stop:30525 length:315 start_codon:yes stop_codon:yes gene_type:complete
MSESITPIESMSDWVEGEHEVIVCRSTSRVWINAGDGSSVGRFSPKGIDLHNTVTDMLAGAPECRFCTHHPATIADWTLFRERALEWFGVHLAEDEIDTGRLLP